MRISTGNFDSIFYVGVTPFFVLRNLTKMKEFVSATKTAQQNFVKHFLVMKGIMCRYAFLQEMLI